MILHDVVVYLNLKITEYHLFVTLLDTIDNNDNKDENNNRLFVKYIISNFFSGLGPSPEVPPSVGVASNVSAACSDIMYNIADAKMQMSQHTTHKTNSHTRTHIIYEFNTYVYIYIYVQAEPERPTTKPYRARGREGGGRRACVANRFQVPPPQLYSVKLFYA